MVENWWSEMEGAILDCLRNDGPMSPKELACRIGASDGETMLFLSMLIGAGKVRPGLAEATVSIGGGYEPVSPWMK